MPDSHRYEVAARIPIGEAARIAGVSISTLRRWEQLGQITPLRTPGGQRRYRLEDIQALLSVSSSAAVAS